MPRIQRQAITPFSDQQMFDLVNDVAQYPEFLPWCAQTKILAHTPDYMKAEVTVAKGPLKHSFITENTLVAPSSIQMALIDGPFKQLSGAWEFTPLKGATQIDFLLHFELASTFLKFSFGPVFQQATQTMMQSFIKRAKTLYG